MEIAKNSIINEIRSSIDQLKFGTVTIKVHAGKVIQIEVTEKKRFDDPVRSEEGGGI